ncbi:MAG: hypothetical protein J6C05_01755 [Prevotella sp.]|nr:hypothetical protein [Prevotella sp.]
MSHIVGISQRISIKVIEQAMDAALSGTFTPELAADLAATEFNGPNRIKKAQTFIGHFTLRNPLFEFVKEHEQEYRTALHHKDDRTIIFVALINAAYEFGYDITSILGKFFHVQDEVTTKLITSKLSTKYCNNRSLPNGMYCILPMYIEAGFINRPKIGIFTKNSLSISSSFTRKLYEKSFSLHNPMLDEFIISELEHPYFEFIK